MQNDQSTVQCIAVIAATLQAARMQQGGISLPTDISTVDLDVTRAGHIYLATEEYLERRASRDQRQRPSPNLDIGNPF